MVTVLPETVATAVFELEKLTVPPGAEALRPKAPSPYVFAASDPNEMDWELRGVVK